MRNALENSESRADKALSVRLTPGQPQNENRAPRKQRRPMRDAADMNTFLARDAPWLPATFSRPLAAVALPWQFSPEPLARAPGNTRGKRPTATHQTSNAHAHASPLIATRVTTETSSRQTLTPCYAVVLPGRKSAFRAGFLPDCYREATEIGPPAGRRPAGGPMSVLSQ